jgi:hypothetical protein
VAIFVIPAALTYTFGKMVGDTRQGWAIFAALSVHVSGRHVGLCTEPSRPAIRFFPRWGCRSAATAAQPGGNMEGKEVRFGSSATPVCHRHHRHELRRGELHARQPDTAWRTGPAGQHETGEVIFGGVGAGLYGILLYAIIAVFIAGLMVGRTPEYLGKKIEQKEVKMAMLAMIATSAGILHFQRHQLRRAVREGRILERPVRGGHRNLNNGGPHGFARSCTVSPARRQQRQRVRGHQRKHAVVQPDAGGDAVGRFLFLIPLLAAAGQSGREEDDPVTSGTFPTHGPLFVGLLVGTVIIISADLFPALSLGPIVEHYLMHEAAGCFLIPAASHCRYSECVEISEDDPDSLLPKRLAHSRPLFDRISRRATKDSFGKLNPMTLSKNPVMFVVEVGAALTTVFLLRDMRSPAPHAIGFELQIAVWLWFTVLFANFAEAMAEARGKAQADSLRKTKTDAIAKRRPRTVT